jgi:hypothetical protein
MSHKLFATILWSQLALSLLLTSYGFGAARWEALTIAALLSLVCALFTIFSIGAFIVLLTLAQAGAAVALKRKAGARGWLAAIGLPTGVWLATVGILLAPYGF